MSATSSAMTPDPPRRENRRGGLPRQDWGIAFDLGIRMGVSVMIGVFGGLALDGLFGTRPIFTLLGVALGMTAAMYALWDVARRSMRR